MDPLKATPIIINIKNLTDEKLYNVNVFNENYEKQDKIKYSATVGYGNLLNMKKGVDSEISKISHIVFCDYDKFLKKQTFSEIKIIEKEGLHETSSVETFFNKINSAKNGMAEINNIKVRLFKGLNIQYAFLMPETEIKFFIYTDH